MGTKWTNGKVTLGALNKAQEDAFKAAGYREVKQTVQEKQTPKKRG